MSGHPTPRELDEWIVRLSKGQATSDMLPRVKAAYTDLWRLVQFNRGLVDADTEHERCAYVSEIESFLNDAFPIAKGQQELF